MEGDVLAGIAAPAGTVGWVIHVSHGATLGVVFAAILQANPDLAASTVERATAGAVYAVLLWVLLAAIVMPVWLGAVGFADAPPLPNFNPVGLVDHIVYGVVLRAVFQLVADL